MDDPRLDRVEKILALPILFTTAVFLCLVLLPFIAQLSAETLHMLQVCEWLTWGLFALEFVIRVIIAKDKKQFLYSNMLDTAVVILPAFTPLLPDARYLIALRVISSVALMLEVGKDLLHLMRARNLPYAVVGSLLICLLCGTLTYHFEHTAAGSNISTPQDGVWWAITTMSTVGYGDKYPVTDIGRLLALPLMILGPLFIGILTAGLTAIMLQPTEAELEAAHRAEDERMAQVFDQKVVAHLKPLGEQLAQALKLLEAHGLTLPETPDVPGTTVPPVAADTPE